MAEPMFTAKEKRTLVKGGLGLAALYFATPYIVGALAVGLLLVLFAVGLFASAVGWLMKYGLLALGLYVVFVLTMRWLHGGAKRKAAAPPVSLDALERQAEEDSTRSRAVLDAQLELELLKQQLRAEQKDR